MNPIHNQVKASNMWPVARTSPWRYTTKIFVLLLLISAQIACSGNTSSSAATATGSAAEVAPADTATAESVEPPTATTESEPDVPVELPTVTLVPQAFAADDGTVKPIAPEDLRLDVQLLVDGLSQPLYLTHAGDGSGRLFIVEQGGAIRIWKDDQLLEEPFLDVGGLVGGGHSEQGLLGLAFEPNYAETGRFYIDYTDRNGDTVVARYSVSSDDPNRADAGSAQQVLQIDQPASNHNGGMLAFGPDGYLYIGMGDGGGSFDTYGNGQNAQSLLGAMLRIDVVDAGDGPYAIPTDNPWVSADLNGVDARDELWAIGLRNPWRYSFDSETGDLWIADVGQNQYEEVNFSQNDVGGENYGWPIQEGMHCVNEPCDATGLVQPVLEYDHQGNCSITGGYVYRGTAIPDLQGFYLYGDFCSGTIWAAARDGETGEWRSAPVVDFARRLSSFGEDADGNVYAIDLGGGVYELVAAE